MTQNEHNIPAKTIQSTQQYVPAWITGISIWNYCVPYKRTGTSKDADFSSFTLSVIQVHWCSLIQNKALYCRVISSKHCEVTASCNKAKPSSILLKPESCIVFRSFENTLTDQEFARVMTTAVLKLGIVDQDPKVRQHISTSGKYWKTTYF